MKEYIKKHKNIICFSALVTICVLLSFYIIYKLSNAFILVVAGIILLIVGSFIKEPEEFENFENKDEETLNVTQLTIFSEEVLEPIILKEEKKRTTKKEKPIVMETKKKTRKTKSKEVLNIENTNSYQFDKVKIKKTKKVKA